MTASIHWRGPGATHPASGMGNHERRIVVSVGGKVANFGVDQRRARRLAVNPRALQNDGPGIDADACALLGWLRRRSNPRRKRVREAKVAGRIRVHGSVDIID